VIAILLLYLDGNNIEEVTFNDRNVIPARVAPSILRNLWELLARR